jgi:hypothetical protein
MNRRVNFLNDLGVCAGLSREENDRQYTEQKGGADLSEPGWSLVKRLENQRVLRAQCIN